MDIAIPRHEILFKACLFFKSENSDVWITQISSKSNSIHGLTQT